jgi:sugar O-acyltransferase (sialic acid O-acetyltransferase NeuD family)
MNKPIYLLGSGGHGRVLLDVMLKNKSKVSGILDPKLEIGDRIFGIKVVGGNEFLKKSSPQKTFLVNGIGANPNTAKRKNIFKKMKSEGFEFFSVRHSSAVIGGECFLGEGVQVMAHAAVQSGVKLGDNVVVNTRAVVDHDSVIGAHVFISPGAVICGDVNVGDAAFIGAGAVILPGIQIGSNAIIGAGAVVTRSVPEECVVAGNPAKKIGVKKHG